MPAGTVSWKLEGLGPSPSWATEMNCLPFCSLFSTAEASLVSRLVLDLERKIPACRGDSPVSSREKGSWGPVVDPPGDENSLAQALGRPPPHCGIQLEPGGSVWSLPAWRWVGIEAT